VAPVRGTASTSSSRVPMLVALWPFFQKNWT
jgi:hypothetical protein